MQRKKQNCFALLRGGQGQDPTVTWKMGVRTFQQGFTSFTAKGFSEKRPQCSNCGLLNCLNLKKITEILVNTWDQTYALGVTLLGLLDFLRKSWAKWKMTSKGILCVNIVPHKQLAFLVVSINRFCLLLSLHCNGNQITFCGHCKITVIFVPRLGNQYPIFCLKVCAF